MNTEKIKEYLEQIIRHAKDNEPYQVEELVNIVLAELTAEQKLVSCDDCISQSIYEGKTVCMLPEKFCVLESGVCVNFSPKENKPVCETCGGDGKFPSLNVYHKQIDCPTCGGSGEVPTTVAEKLVEGYNNKDIMKPLTQKKTCPDCQKQEDKVAALEIRQLIIDLAFHSQKPNPATIFKKLDVLIDRQQKEIEELNGWKEIAQESGGKIRVLISKYKIGLGGENIYDLVCDFADGLTQENASLKYNLTEFKRICDEVKLENASLKEALAAETKAGKSLLNKALKGK